jgi:hypothetical protein
LVGSPQELALLDYLSCRVNSLAGQALACPAVVGVAARFALVNVANYQLPVLGLALLGHVGLLSGYAGVVSLLLA